MKQVCVMPLGSPCSGEVKKRAVFNSTISIPVCDRHYKSQNDIAILFNAGFDAKMLLELTEARRAEMVLVPVIGGFL